MKLTDLSKLASLIPPEDAAMLANVEKEKKAKRKMGDGQSVRVILDTKLRRGRSVTVISELSLSSEMRDKLAKELKQKLSAGGTVHNDEIEIQGDHVKRVVEYLKANAFDVRLK